MVFRVVSGTALNELFAGIPSRPSNGLELRTLKFSIALARPILSLYYSNLYRGLALVTGLDSDGSPYGFQDTDE